ncbi:sensor histidine kinase [Ideonella livida]|uniref:histidine kinase n=1 Tax=Ideonella livida TaxID=2707176 RepID=A0A7C9THQ6_9BURK|nr:sensor histidine kinase [Ideonella livida]NDY90660.1 sensor histidine kinase [Ideonella livida]
MPSPAPRADRRRRWLRLTGPGRSLHQQLLLWTLTPQLVLWLAGALFTYNLALRYANEAVDASLLQSLRSLARQVKPIGNGLYVDFPRAAQDILEADPRDRLLYTVSSPPGQFLLGNRNLPPPEEVTAALGLPLVYDSVLGHDDPAVGAQPVRVAALFIHYGDEMGPSQTMLVQVARSSASRQEVARRILVDTVLPLSLLMLLLSTLVWMGLRAGLAPLDHLRRQVEGRAPDDLQPLEIDAAAQEVRALALAINTLMAQVQHSVQAQKRFISDAAHQLRTPLAGLKSQTELALQRSQDPEQAARLRRVHDSAVRSAHLVNQLLTLARAEPEAARQQAHVPLDITALARQATADLVPRALALGVDLGFDDPDGDGALQGLDDVGSAQLIPAAPGPQVRGIALLLREALVNVIDNALRYAGRGATVTVRVAVGPAHQVCLWVEDDGPGIPAQERERVFERFVRLAHDAQGCGLGLSIVKDIVRLHGGQVSLLPREPRGLSVGLCLPICNA